MFGLAKGERVTETLGGYDITISGPLSTIGAMGAGTGSEAAQAEVGYGLVIASGKDEFLIIGRGINVRFAAPGDQVEIDSAQEGVFDKGRWIPGRTMNGDERYALFPEDGLRIIRMTLLRHR